MANANAFDHLKELFTKAYSKYGLSVRSDFLHPYVGMKAIAYLDTLQYIKNHMCGSVMCLDRNEVFNYAIKHLTIDGLYLEFGVKTGKTIKILGQKLRNKTIYGFDSFAGLPSDWTGNRKLQGQLDAKGKLPKIAKNIRLIQGWFKDTLPNFSKDHKENIALIHIDCDIYSSTKDIFDGLGEKITKGTVLIFDEYFNYPNWQAHEFKAFAEFTKKHRLKYKYLCYAHTQVVVVIL